MKKTSEHQEEVSIKGTPNFQELKNPFAGMTKKQRAEAAKILGEKGKSGVQEALQTIEEIFAKHDGLQALSMIANYELNVGIGDNGIAENKSKKDPIGQYHLELCQAIFLGKETPKKWLPVTPEVYQKLRDALHLLTESLAFLDFDPQDLNLSEQELAIKSVQKRVRDHTKTIRNWGYFHQVIRISQELYSPFDSILLEKMGFSATQVIGILNELVSVTEVELNKRFHNLADLYKHEDVKSLVYRYHELLALDKEKADSFLKFVEDKKASREQVFSLIMSHYDLFLMDMFSHSPVNIANKLGISRESVLSAMDEFSLEPGELSCVSIENLLLSNPVWKKPLVKISQEKIFSPAPQIFFSFILQSLDQIVRDLSSKNFSKVRAKFLEDKVKEIVETRFPSSEIVKNIKWKSEGEEYETDVLAFIDSYAIVFEAKSGRVTESAFRGSPGRIKNHLKDIFFDPSKQSARIKDKILNISAGRESDSDFEKQMPVDLTRIKKVLRVSVSFEDLAAIQSNLNGLKGTGWLPEDFSPCPTMCLADFETLFDLLEHPIEIIHYLERRSELENERDVYGDELDLMGLYLDTGLNLDIPPEEKLTLHIFGHSKEVDNYYISKYQGVEIEKPKPRITQLWSDILSQLEGRRVDRWLELGTLLLRVPFNAQTNMVEKLGSMIEDVRLNWDKEENQNILIFNPSTASNSAVAFMLFRNQNANKRHNFIDHAASLAFEQPHVKYCAVIGKNIDRNDLAYHTIALVLRPDSL